MKFTPRQEKLLSFVKEAHGEQKRKYTGEPYWHHLVEVAEIVSEYESDGLCVEVALCHDLLEDTPVSAYTIMEIMKRDYSVEEIRDVINSVMDLTDVYTKKNYPTENRYFRKLKEAKRIAHSSYLAQTVKYGDLISNTKSIAAHDPGFAEVYLLEKKQILDLMTGGNQSLRRECQAIWSVAMGISGETTI